VLLHGGHYFQSAVGFIQNGQQGSSIAIWKISFRFFSLRKAFVQERLTSFWSNSIPEGLLTHFLQKLAGLRGEPAGIFGSRSQRDALKLAMLTLESPRYWETQEVPAELVFGRHFEQVVPR
jgi:hypothetical protein